MNEPNSRCRAVRREIANRAGDAYLKKQMPLPLRPASSAMRGMFKPLLRLMSMIVLAIAVIMAVRDATRSIAAEAIVWTPLGESWAAISPSTLADFKSTMLQGMPSYVWDPLVVGLLDLPGFAVAFGLSLMLGFTGRRRMRAGNRFAMQ